MLEPQQNTSFESNLNKAMYSGQKNSTWTGQVMTSDEIDKIEELIKQDLLTREDLRNLTYLLNAKEIKMINLGENSRYYLGKFTTWIQDAAAIQLNHLRDYELTKKFLTDLGQKAKEQTSQLNDEAIKKLCQIYLFFSRSSLSLGATGFDTMTKTRFEHDYKGDQYKQPESKGWFK